MTVRELIRDWIRGRIANGNAASMSVRDDVLYSYNMPLAIHHAYEYGVPRRKIVVLVVDTKVSYVTSRHRSMLLEELVDYPIDVPRGAFTSIENCDYQAMIDYALSKDTDRGRYEAHVIDCLRRTENKSINFPI